MDMIKTLVPTNEAMILDTTIFEQFKEISFNENIAENEQAKDFATNMKKHLFQIIKL